MIDRATLNRMLEVAADHPAEGLRFLDRFEKETWLSWTEVHERARRTAGALGELGVARGDRVALIFPTCAEFFDAFFGTLLAGAVPVPLYPPVRLGRLDEYADRTAAMLRASGTRLLLADRRVRRLLGPALERTWPELGCQVMTSLPEAEPTSVDVEPSELAMVQFSSGTTVAPKPVALSHRAVVAQTRCLNALWPPTADRRESGVSWLPLYHDMGLIGCVFPALDQPSTLTLIPPELFVARPAVWLRAISRYRATISPAPNFAYGLCVDKIRDEQMEGVDLSSWRVALNGAEAVAPRVLRRFQERFRTWGFRPEALTPVYGLSEASLAVTFSDLDRPFTSTRFDRDALAACELATEDPDGIEIVSVGRPLARFELRVLDPDNRALEAGRVGRILVRGPSLMEGYLDRPLETAQALRDGWLDTGDLGFLFGGELYLTGRAKDVLILRGRNHSPVEVEHVLDEVDGLRIGCSVAVSFLPEGSDGEKLILLAEASKEVAVTDYPRIAAAAARRVRSRAGLDPDHVEVLEPGTLPRTTSGKLRRSEALRLFRRGELVAPDPVTPLRLMGSLAQSAFAFARARRHHAAC